MGNAAHPSLAVGTLLLATASVQAAGGHFDVDDAFVLDTGHCQYQTWLVRAPAGPATMFHLGPGCRIGPVEIGVNFDRAMLSDQRRTLLGPQLKWVVDPLIDTLSAGLVGSATFDLQQGGRPVRMLYAPVTWRAADKLWFHANLGLDWGAAGARTRRIGGSGEWAISDRWTVIAERVKLAGDWTSRLGARLSLNDSISIDLSAARVTPRATHVYVIGLNHDFAR